MMVTFSMINIEPIGRGSVLKELRGTYTTKNMAMRAIDRVLSLKEEKTWQEQRRQRNLIPLSKV